ncbi:MAG: DnaJ domain-containing protein [Actinobacteria bacterium]|nr:DnaJ domain-containing protein [Actinomycetota bacterium]
MQREWFEKDYYALLGVAPKATAKEITAAYRKLARKLHPDANPGDSAAEDQFKEVSAAYEVIGDADKRAEYDEARRVGPMSQGFGPSGTQPGGPGFGGPGGARFDGPDISDLIGNLFSRGGRGQQQPPPSGPRRGTDIEADLHLAFDDSIRGATTTVNVTSDVRCPDCSGSGAAPGTSPKVCPECHGSRPCSTCGGRGRVIEVPCMICAGTGAVRRPRQVKVRIPQGVRDGQKIRIKGKGGAGANGGPAGDLYVRVHVESHPLFGRKGDHLTVTLPITYPEAALGADISVPTTEGEPVTIRVPAGTASGRTFRVRGRGVAGAKAQGDLLVTVEIDIPQNLSTEEREALQAYAALASESPRAHLGAPHG